MVYLSPEAEQGRQQWEQRQQDLRAVAARTATGLPAGCPAPLVIDVLRQMMILTPDEGPEQWARQLQRRGRQVTAGQVRQGQEHYALENHVGVETYLHGRSLQELAGRAVEDEIRWSHVTGPGLDTAGRAMSGDGTGVVEG